MHRADDPVPACMLIAKLLRSGPVRLVRPASARRREDGGARDDPSFDVELDGQANSLAV
jgi:hypothetical protein